jgi:hypothetical protein
MGGGGIGNPRQGGLPNSFAQTIGGSTQPKSFDMS